MKPIKLTFQAFGPFADKQEVDFDKLGHAPLFLINGPTGAGKSTLLDAICFALYGETTGSERTGDQMRCDQADAKQLTFVDFTFSLAGQNYRIERSPEQQVPKQRGEGTTKKSHSASLYKLDGDNEILLAHRPSPVAKEVIELMGLDVKQFRQVMVIPQGRFRELLTANSKEREQIFGQLFSTHIYRDIERVLFEQAADIRKQKDQFDNQIKGVLELAEVETEDQLQAAIEEHTPQVAGAAKMLESAKQAQDIATQQWQQANKIVEKFKAQQNLKHQQQQLEQQALAVDEQRSQIKRARLATALSAAYQAQNTSQKAFERAVQKSAQAQQALKVATDEQSRAQLGFEQAKQQSEQLPELEKRSYQLHAQIEQLKQYQAQQAKLVAAEQSLSSIGQAMKATVLQQQAAQSALIQAQQQQEQAKQASLELPVKEQLEKALAKQLSVLKEIDTTRQACAQSQQLLASATQQLSHYQQAFNQAKTFADQQEYQWHSTQAAQLAQLLNDGEACPVCGSESHPSPAMHQGQLVTKEDVDHARSAQQQAFNQVEQQQRIVQGFTVEQGKVDKALEGWSRLLNEELSQDPQQLLQEQSQVSHELKALRSLSIEKAHQQLQQCEAQVAELEKNYQQHELVKQQSLQEKNNLDGQLATLKASLGDAHDIATTTKMLDATKQAIESNKQAFNTAQQHYTKAQQALAVATTTVQADAQAQQEAESEASKQAQLWQEQLASSDFSDVDAFLKASLSREQLDGIEQTIEQFDKAYAQNLGALQQIDSELKAVEPPDLQALSSSMEQASNAYQQALSQHTQIQSVMNNLTKVKARLADLYLENEKLDKAYQVFGTLSDVANGKTGSKVSLHRFVLGVLLDDVLIQATQRLRLMSKGRYELLRKEQRAKGNVGSGLDLLVEDAYSGKTRDVATLSGGESFMAALALALGLSDVVQSYSGGIRLDTLFIDEGFGSLDPESLDLAIQTLMELQQTGRTIGIISHVSELKEQMSLRIDVSPSRRGSQLSVSQ
ncbi:AAA family ATPase [Vibrio agarivorans]|uniref:AAA family ATPase n=1 Tax=Vibrio agarivorans TaxID=153622 RepID=UPI00223075B0|nr:SMC family ATPase [Vibrio agarivorans]